MNSYPLFVCGQMVLLESPELAAALSALSQTEQEIIFLYYFQQLTHREIGQRYGRAGNTTGRRIQMFLRQLRAELEGLSYEPAIHVHIVINSLRIYEVPLLPYMDRPADTREGCKHRCTNAAMEYFKSEVMEMCHREGLYQIDLLNGSKERITEREYWAAKKGQLALDKENAAREAAGQPTKDNAGAALIEAAKKATGLDPVEVGTYRGFTMSVTLEDFGKKYVLTMQGRLRHQATLGSDPRGNLIRLDNALAQMPQRLKAFQTQLDETCHQQEAAKDELEMIHKKMAQYGTTNLSAFLRKMSIDGYVVKLELPELKEMVSLLRYSSNNLNQLTKRVHETSRIYDADLEDIRKSHERLWDAARDILSALAKLN